MAKKPYKLRVPKQRRARKDTNVERQKSVVANLVDNGGNLRQAMLDSGYPVTKDTKHIMKSQSFIELLDEVGISDIKIANKLAEGLEATKSVVMNGGEFIDLQPDFATRHKYLETLLKVKGHIGTDVQKKMNISIKYKPLLAGDTAHRKPIEGVVLKDTTIEAEVIKEASDGVRKDDSNGETSWLDQED